MVLKPDHRFFYWRIFAKFRPEKHGFDMYKRFFMEKKNGPNSPDFENKDSKIARLYDNLWKVAKNIEGTCCPFYLQIGYVTEICLNYFMDDHHFDHITKS